jgi:aryl-alcohol dehydrogenase-like predicted oxidoreductase
MNQVATNHHESMTQTSPLGFGCSSLMGRMSEKDSLRILACAYEHGIRHFDVARSYGYGEAERALGKFLKDKRDRVTVTTKVGLVPPKPFPGISFVRTAARAVVALAPGLKSTVNRGAAAMVKKEPLSPELIKTSLQTSLQQLGTDCVDILLLHECTADELGDDRILAVLEGFVSQGKIRAFGVGSDLPKVPALLKERRAYLQVLQLENNPLVCSLKRFDVRGINRIITHRAVGEVFKKVTGFLASSPETTTKWSHALGINAADPGILSALFLAYAIHQNPQGKVLFSTRSEHHLAGNAKILDEQKAFSPGQFPILEALTSAVP